MRDKEKIGFMAWLVAGVVVLSVVWVVPIPIIVRFGVIAFALIVNFGKGGKYKLQSLYFAFLLICMLSILFNQIPEKFRPWERFGIFTVVYMLVSPMISSEGFNKFRVNQLKAMMKFFIIVTLLSVVFFAIGINRMATGGEAGATTQVMIMGPIAGITLIYSIYKFFNHNKQNKKIKYFYLICAAAGLIMVLVARSRIALIATFVGIIALFMFLSKFNSRSLSRLVPGIILMLVLAVPLWNSFSSDIVKKNEDAIEKGSMTSSRDNLWRDRIEEFKMRPLTGVGFSYLAINSNVIPVQILGRFAMANSMNHTDSSIFQAQAIEPGTSWLAILSMTGIFGFILFIIIFWTSLKFLKKVCSLNDADSDFSLYASLLIFFGIHMFAEGYVLSAGSLFCYLFWSVLGAIQGKKSLWVKQKLVDEEGIRHSLSD